MRGCRNEIFNDGAGYAMTQLHIQLAATATQRWPTMNDERSSGKNARGKAVSLNDGFSVAWPSNRATQRKIAEKRFHTKHAKRNERTVGSTGLATPFYLVKR